MPVLLRPGRPPDVRFYLRTEPEKVKRDVNNGVISASAGGKLGLGTGYRGVWDWRVASGPIT